APPGWRIMTCLADGAPVDFEPIADGMVGARLERPPRQIVLEGTHGGITARSAAGWVDHEWELRSTARGRSVAEAIRSRVRAGEWGVGAWAEVLEVFCRHLRYLPPHVAGTQGGHSVSSDRDQRPIEY